MTTRLLARNNLNAGTSDLVRHAFETCSELSTQKFYRNSSARPFNTASIFNATSVVALKIVVGNCLV